MTSLWIWQKYLKKDESNILLFKVSRGNITEIVSARGEVVPDNKLNLSFPYSNTLSNLFVKKGNEVKKGEKLAQLDSQSFNLKKEQLEALLSQQQAALKNINEAVELWIKTAEEFGDPVPEPKCHRLMLA